MRLESPAFGQNEAIPVEYTFDGANRLPPLRLVGVPEEAVSLAFVVDDPDAPGGTFTHWTIWNVPPLTSFLDDEHRPDGVEGRTDFDLNGWSGPCPSSGTHRYFFKAFALDAVLDLPTGADASALMSAIHGHIIDKAGLIGTYEHRAS
jgi:Raf kinase inhibitor-like YbhB/YbcL family protein